MTKPTGWIVAMACIFSAALRAGTGPAENWTRPVEVTYESKRCIAFRARLSGSFLVVEAAPSAGWHTFAMDNAERAAEKLQGKKSLGLDLPTEIIVANGLEVEGPWYQTPPKDFSQPELRWFSWGFEGLSLFAAKVRRTGPGPAQVAIRGQVCTEEICRRVDVAITIPLAGTGTEASDIDLKSLVQVQRAGPGSR